MQRVSSLLPTWDKRKSSQKSQLSNPIGASTNTTARSWWPNRASNASSLAKINVAAANDGRVQKEAFWPATLDQECDKAARILKSFCTDGYLAPLEDEPSRAPSPSAEPTEPATPVKITKKIPKRVLQNAAGIAIFTCMRSGLWMTGSGGSGILIARKSDGTWSPPSGIMLHTPTLSFIIGVDVYDCVLVVNNLAALESITRPRVTLGDDVQLKAGPSVPLDSTETQILWKDLGNTVLTYLKARGQHQKVNLNGCILTERGNENERFYAGNVSQMDVLAGNVNRHVEETAPLFEVIKMAEGRTDFDSTVIDRIAAEPAPGDAVIATPKSTSPASPRNAFGVPSAHDPDPFGVLALEMAGLEIREAGTQLRPGSHQFDFNPQPPSPALTKFNRQSVDMYATRSNRGSYLSTHTTKSQVTDAGTQTDVKETPDTSPSPAQSEIGGERHSLASVSAVKEEEEEVDYTTVDLTPLRHISQSPSFEGVPVTDSPFSSQRQSSASAAPTVSAGSPAETSDTPRSTGSSEQGDDVEKSDNTNDADDEECDSEEEEPVVFEVAAVQPARTQAVASRVIHANMVTIGKRVPPPLPTKNPARVSRSSKTEMGGDVVSLRSPLRQAFGESDFSGTDEETKRQQDDVQADEPTAAESLSARSSIQDIMLDVAESAAMKSDTEAGESKTPTGSAPTEQDDVPARESMKMRNSLSSDSKENSEKEDDNFEDTASLDDESQAEKPESIADSQLTSQCLDEQPQKSESDDEGNDRTEQQANEESLERPVSAGRQSADESKKAALSIQIPQNEHTEANAVESDCNSISEFHDAEAEYSDSVSKKHASSIYTRMTEDRWSHDGTSATTPTSDRPHSAAEESRSDDTPTKSGKQRMSHHSEEMMTPLAASTDASVKTESVV